MPFKVLNFEYSKSIKMLILNNNFCSLFTLRFNNKLNTTKIGFKNTKKNYHLNNFCEIFLKFFKVNLFDQKCFNSK